MTLPDKSVQVRRTYYGSGTPVSPVYCDDISDNLPSTDVLDTVLLYGNQFNISGFTWDENLGKQVASSGNDADPIGDTLRADALAYWKLNENSGTRIDSTSRGNDLSVHSPSQVSGVNGYLTINSDTLNVGQGAIYKNINNDLTNYNVPIFYLAGWIKINVNSDMPALISVWDNDYGEEYAVEFFAIPETTTGFYDLSAGISAYVESDPVEHDAWTFVEIYTQYPSENYGIAVNNGAFVTGNGIGFVSTSGTKFNFGYYTILGAFTDNANHFSAKEWGIYNTMLTQEQRDYLYNAGNGRTLYP